MSSRRRYDATRGNPRGKGFGPDRNFQCDALVSNSLSVSDDVFIGGKLTVDGVIDPPALVLAGGSNTVPQTPTDDEGTLWVNDAGPPNELVFTPAGGADENISAAIALGATAVQSSALGTSVANSLPIFADATGNLIDETPTRTLIITGTNLSIGPSTTMGAINIGANNTVFGNAAAAGLTDGNYNTIIGYNACPTNATGGNNVVIGSGTDLGGANVNDAVVIGTNAYSRRTAVAIGYNARAGVTSTMIGANAGALMTTGVGIGANALANCTGAGNVGIGFDAGTNLTSSTLDVLVGVNVGATVDTGGGVVLIGANTDVAAGTTANCIGIGNGATAVATDEVVLDNDSTGTNVQTFLVPRLNTLGGPGTTVEYLNGEIGQMASSRRFKENIQDLEDMSHWIDALRPVSFNFTKTGLPSFGLIAEEVAERIPLLVPLDTNGEPFSVRYDLLSVILLQRIQQMDEEIRDIKCSLY